jgi:hypothetical protein
MVSRVVFGVVAVVIGWIVLQVVLGWLYSLIRVAVIIALLGVVLWFVFVGPSSLDE